MSNSINESIPFVLVTGACGMIGSVLVEALLKRGYKVIGLDKCKSNITNINYIHIVVDLANKHEVEYIAKTYSITHSIHLAALAHSKKGVKFSKEDFFQANVANATNVFEVFKSKKILFISTVDVYGFTKGKIVDDNTKCNPVTIYGKSKAQAEEELWIQI